MQIGHIWCDESITVQGRDEREREKSIKVSLNIAVFL